MSTDVVAKRGHATWYLVTEEPEVAATSPTSCANAKGPSSKFFVTTIRTLPQRPKNFKLIKYSLIAIIIVNIIQTVIFIPLIGDILTEISKLSPYLSKPDTEVNRVSIEYGQNTRHSLTHVDGSKLQDSQETLRKFREQLFQMQNSQKTSQFLDIEHDQLIITIAILSVLITLFILTLGLIGAIFENIYLLIAFVLSMLCSITFASVPHVRHKMVLMAMVSDVIVAFLAAIFARMLVKVRTSGCDRKFDEQSSTETITEVASA